MTLEQRLERLEKHNRCLTTVLAMMTVAVCAAVNMAAIGARTSTFDTVEARTIFVMNDAGRVAVVLGANGSGDGLVATQSAQGKDLVMLNSTPSGGAVTTYHRNGKELVRLTADSDDTGGFVSVYNKTGERIVEMYADDYGNGVVGAWNRKGKGRTLQPGP